MKNLKALMTKKNITQINLSVQIGVTQETISAYLNNKAKPSADTLIKIADYLDISLLYLLAKNNQNDFIRAVQETTFHERLQQLAKEKNQKSSEIAHAMIFPESYFHDWFRTKTLPSLDYLLSIAEYFDVSPDYLLGRTDYRN